MYSENIMEHANIIDGKKIGGLLLGHWYVELPRSVQKLGDIHLITLAIRSSKDAFSLS
jgi:hypothetical protein